MQFIIYTGNITESCSSVVSFLLHVSSTSYGYLRCATVVIKSRTVSFSLKPCAINVVKFPK